MSTSADQQLHELYLEAGAEYAGMGQPLEAADAYALAAYYARRLANRELERHCRELVVRHNPDHLGAQEKPEPLFYAQLLIRHPADEVHRSLEASRKRQVAATPSDGHVEIVSPPVAVMAPPCAEALGRQAPVDSPRPPERAPLDTAPKIPAKPPYPSTAVFETHHVFDLGTAAAQDRLQSLRVTEDLLAQDAQLESGLGASEPEEAPSSLNVAGSIAAFVGFAAIGFFVYELQPVFSRLRLPEAIRSIYRQTALEKTPPSDAAPKEALPVRVSLKPAHTQSPVSTPR